MRQFYWARVLLFVMTSYQCDLYAEGIQRVETYLVEENSAAEAVSFQETFESKMSTLKSYDEALEKEEQALKILNKRKIYRSHDADDKKKKFYIDRNIVIENCYIGASYQIIKKDGEVLFQKEGPIDLRRVTSIEKSERFFSGYRGHLVNFKTNKKSEDHFLVYRSEKKRDQIYEKVLFMSSLCAERFKLARKIGIVETHEGRVLKRLQLKDKEYENHFTRPVRLKEDERGQKAALLTGGEAAWKGRLYVSHLAQEPKDAINIQTLIFMADQAGIFWSSDLIEKRKKGIPVEVLIDALSSFLDLRDLNIRSNTPIMYNNMMAAGIPVYGFRCMGTLKHRLIDELKLSDYFNASIYDQRPHEKIWTVGDRHVIVGGLNVGNDYFRLNKVGYGFWRDQDILIKSKLLTQDFINIFKGNVLSYEANYKSPKKDDCFNPYDPILEKAAYEKFYKKHFIPYHLDRFRSSKKKHQKFALSKIETYQNEFEASEKALKFYSFDSAQAVHNRPKLREHHIENSYISMIDKAEKELIISNSYFIPSLPIKRAIRRASRRGVRVVILTNSYESNDVPPVAILGQHAYKELIDETFGQNDKDGREIEIYEWTGKTAGDHKVKQGTNHGKFLISDRKRMFIGSYNLDPRSRDINSEVGVAMESPVLAEELATFFFEEDLKYASRISYSQMLAFRREASILETAWLKLHGSPSDLSLVRALKRGFFYHVAKYNELTW